MMTAMEIEVGLKLLAVGYKVLDAADAADKLLPRVRLHLIAMQKKR